MPDSSSSAVLDFLARLLRDRALGEERPLDEYLALYPGNEGAVREEFERLTRNGPPPADADGPTTTLGPFRLLSELGRGGQGSVWKAEDTRLARQVAIKIVPRSPLVDDLTPRLRREAELLGRLDDPGLCPVYDVGSDGEVAWMAMRLVEGRTLRAAMDDSEAPIHAADPISTLTLIERIARIVHVAHESGVVHRDLKPGNVMIGANGKPVVLDFGVAVSEGDGPALTLNGDVVGTPAYLAPERLAMPGDQRARRADRRSDVWSLGVMLHEALAGSRPFEGPSRDATMLAVLHRDPPAVPGLPRELLPDLALVMHTALEKEPDRRYATALAFAEDLRCVRVGEPVAARPTPRWHLARRWMTRNPALACVLGALLLVLIVATAVSWSLLQRTRETLANVTRLSDQKIIRDLMLEADLPRPPTPETARDLRAWLDSARNVSSRRAAHQRAEQAARARLQDETGRAQDPQELDDAWFVEQLDELLADLTRLELVIPVTDKRWQFSRDVDALTIDAHAATWSRAAAAVKRDARFDELTLSPQRGLVPIGADPRSGLQEFAHLQSGEIPGRTDDGTLLVNADMALVLVLIPGGSTTVGSEHPRPERPDGSPHADPMTGEWDGPVQSVELDPFFLSKYELTQAQWARHTRSNPSAYARGSRFVSDELAGLHPVESISHAESVRVLAQMGLVLPTEVRWEHAARAGSTTVWSTGNQQTSLLGHCNIADAFAMTNGGGDNWHYETWIDDGFVSHAPVGSFLPNAFGLHETIGNLSEWCLDTWEDWTESAPRNGDGFCAPVDGSSFVMRGGTYSANKTYARAAHRNGIPPGARLHYTGLRPARAVHP